MKSGYKHLSAHERITLMLMRKQGLSCRAIARQLKRDPSTISREVALHANAPGIRGTALPYESSRAHNGAFARRARCRPRRKLRHDGPLFKHVCDSLRTRRSPDQIAGRLLRDGGMVNGVNIGTISDESIYTALYAIPRGELRRELLACLRQGHKERWPRSRGVTRKNKTIPDELSIHLRRPEIEERILPGHWEGDFIKGKLNGSAVGTLVERTSRLVLLAQMPDCGAASALEGFATLLGQVPGKLRHSMTYDRGTEMARHAELTERTSMNIYFADPYSPWQRGSNENANGLIREYLTKGTDLSPVTQDELNAIAFSLNNRPRRILAYQTPMEIFVKLLGRAKLDALVAKQINVQ